MSYQMLEGGCQCGAVRYAIDGEPLLVGICHCRMCRKAHAAPAVGWATFRDSQVKVVGDRLQHFTSSPQAQRGFCSNCGTQISFTSILWPGVIDIALGSLDDPEVIRPILHYWHSNHVSWAEFLDDLPRYPELPPFEDDAA